MLKESAVLDTDAGIENCGSAESFLSVLSVFHQTAGQKADEIESAYSNGDLKNYTIKAHALKSSARIIGAKALSEMAKSLEDAGKREDHEFIRSNNDELLRSYRELNSKLSCLDSDESGLPPIDEKALTEAYQTISEIAGSMDYGLMEDILNDLRGYRLTEADRERISKIEQLLTELDWDGILKLVSGV